MTDSSSSGPPSPVSLTSSSRPVVIGLFGFSTSHKSAFFNDACGLVSPTSHAPETSAVRRGTMTGIEGRHVQIWEFPSFYEGDCMRDAEAILRTGGEFRACAGNLQGIVYMRGPDSDDDDDEQTSFELFRSLVGEEAAEKRSIVIPYADDSPTVALDVVSRFIDQPLINTLFHAEIAKQGAAIHDTSFGKHFDRLLDNMGRTIAASRDKLRLKTLHEIGSYLPPSRHTRRRTGSSLAQQLDEAKRLLPELDSARADNQELSEQLVAAHRANQILEEDNTRLRNENARLARDIQDLEAQVNETSPTPMFSGANVQTDDVPSSPNIEATLAPLRDQISSLEAALARLTAERNEIVANTKTSESHTFGLQKRIDGLVKANEAHQKSLDDAKSETKAARDKTKLVESEVTKLKKDLEKAAAKEKSWDDERRDTLKLSNECMKARNDANAAIDSVKSQAKLVETQAKKKIEGLQNELKAAKDQVESAKVESNKRVEALQSELEKQKSQLINIDKAAQAWNSAMAQVERVSDELREEKARNEAAWAETSALQGEITAERARWEEEREWGTAEIRRLTQAHSTTAMEYDMERRLREAEVQGYIWRVSELEEWSNARWDAVGPGCIIA